MDTPIRHKSRGTSLNPQSRFDHQRTEAFDDGWEREADDDIPALKTTVAIDATRSIIARNDSPDVGFDRSINPYRGCEHGCVYCFARPTHAYLGLSPGLDFETKLFAKPDAAALLAKELRHPRYRPAVLAIGTNTDPYQPIERERRIMRQCLEVLAEFNHPVSIVTKSHLITRDIDILGPMARKGLASAAISVTTLDREFSRKLEPRTATPERRLDAIRQLARAGIPTAVLAAPMIPALNDKELEAILEAAVQAGAVNGAYILLRLPHEVKDLFAQWLADHFPQRAEHVLSVLRQCRDGQLYRSDFATRQSGTGIFAQLMARRFAVAARRLGLDKPRPRLRTDLFAPPPQAGDQLILL